MGENLYASIFLIWMAVEAELDFIINYNIKYRMGKALFGEDANED